MCEQQYFLIYNLGYKSKTNISAVKGTIFHRVMQALGDKNLAIQNGDDYVDFEGRSITLNQCDDLELLTRLSFDHYSEKEKDVSLTKTDFNDCLKWANKSVSFNNGFLDPRNQKVLTTEKFFDFEINEDWAEHEYTYKGELIKGRWGLKGTVDLILTEDENTLHVLDYKSGKRKNWATFKEKTYEELEYDNQLLLYLYALRNVYKEKDFVFSIFYLNDGGLFSFVYDDSHYKRAESMLKQKFEYIKNVEIPRQVSPTHESPICKYMCGFSKIKEGTQQSICNFYHQEIKQKGIYNVIDEYSDKKALNSYTGGGRIAE